MSNIKLNLEYSKVTEDELKKYKTVVKKIHNELHEIKENEEQFVGWLEYPTKYDKDEFKKIKNISKKIQTDSDVLIVVGIGGSYLGAKAVIEALNNNFYNILMPKKRKFPQVFFVGNNINPDYVNDLKEYISDKDISLNVISKSGTTTEPAIAFRIFREYLENKYGIEEARRRIYVTTDKSKGALKKLAEEENYETFVIPNNIGGRYSVLTAVGLLPIAVTGIDIEKLMLGARNAQVNYNNNELEYNDCYKYAVIRNILYKNNKYIENLVNYDPKLISFTEWWKQLYGESEGKEGKGIFPAGVSFSTDLHSLGQYIQDGKKNLFETIINVENSKTDLIIKASKDNLDGLNYLEGKSMNYINHKAMEAAIKAHNEGGVPNILINLNKLDEENLGELIYFFELACAMSAKILGVNPFDQPGVEAYKKNMFKLLGKPGYNI